jgi:hypothetical protein
MWDFVSGDFGRLLLGTDTAGAEIEPFGHTVDFEGDRMNIRCPAPVGMALGMADIMPKLGRFAADITFHRWSGSPLTNVLFYYRMPQ